MNMYECFMNTIYLRACFNRYHVNLSINKASKQYEVDYLNQNIFQNFVSFAREEKNSFREADHYQMRLFETEINEKKPFR